VSVQCDAALPPVWADHDRLEQVFVNLLSNAVRHNPPGTQVTVLAAPANAGSRSPSAAPAEVEIRVVDDGPGFPEELARAPFESPRRQRSRSSGAGLGLSIARGIVHAHGGHIALEPVTTGTSFAIRLPIEGDGGPEAGTEGHDGNRAGDTPGAAARRLVAAEPASRS
jgi:signal transduction histidine kinase